MIGYITIGSNDLERAKVFYDALFAGMEMKCLQASDHQVTWGKNWKTAPLLSVTIPYDGKAATVGNGVMLAFQVESREKVDQLHALALQLGASSEGAVGERGTRGFYAGYCRDLDGNKLNIHCN